MATLTGANLVASILETTGIELSTVEQALISQKVQYDIDNGTNSSLSATLTLMGLSADAKAKAAASEGGTDAFVTSLVETTTTAQTAIEESEEEIVVEEPEEVITVDGETFELTTSSDEVHNGTVESDYFDASIANSLQSGDILLDMSTSDTDILNASVTTATVDARIQNVETINITGEYLTAGLDLANVTGAQTLTVNTNLSNGSATITNANSLNAVNIVAGSNIKTLTVDASGVGTRDTVYVDAASATSVVLDGDAGGVDTYDAIVSDGVTVTAQGVGTNDTITIHSAGGDLGYKGTASVENLVINTAAATTITVTTGLGDVNVINSDFDVVIKSTSDLLTGTDATDGDQITSTGSGDITLNVVGITNDDFLNKALVDVVEFSVEPTAYDTITVNGDSTVNLTADLTSTSTDVLNIDIDNIDGDMAVGAGTLLLNVSESQTGIIAVGDDTANASNAGTVILSVTPDEDDDTANGAEITINKLDLDTNGSDANTLVIQGSDNLTINTITNVADTASISVIVSAQDMTGELTIGNIENAYEVLALGSGNDTVTTTSAAGTIYGNDGDDDITTGNASTVYGGAGNDTITGSAYANTIDAGAGDDTIDAGTKVNEITTGAGADTINLTVGDSTMNGTDDTTVTDFTKGTDILVLNGTTTNTAIDVTELTVASGKYTLIATDLLVTLTGNNATDMSDSIKLGTEANALTLVDGSTVIAGDLDDFLVVQGDNTATLTLGGGSDSVVVTIGTAGSATTTVSDFTVGTDKIIIAGGITGEVDLTATQTAGSYSLDDTGSGTMGALFDLTDVTATTLEGIVQLGSANHTFSVATGKSVVGGNFADYIDSEASGTTAAESITAGKGADIIDLTASHTGGTSGVDVLKITAGDSLTTAWDEVTKFELKAATGDKLDLDSTDIATAITTTAVGDITGVTVSNGVITKWLGIDSSTVNADQLTDAIAFLSENVLGATDTVAFEYKSDEDGDGAYTTTGETSTFVFQNGTTETLVELIGVTDVTEIGAVTAAANTIVIA
jgi:hypothetical protein